MTVRDHIIEAFAETPRVRGGGIGSVGDPESDDLAKYFTGKSWRGHSAKQLREHASALSFFTPEGFRYFLPAFMLAELDDPVAADVIAQSILFHLCKADGREDRARILAVNEREAVARFFDECKLRYKDAEFGEGAAELRHGAAG